MSSKLNVAEIIRGHFATLRTTEGLRSRFDIFSFTIIPLLITGALWLAHYDLTSELRSLLVNFGAIFTALLLSVLVLVYDQERKCGEIESTNALARQRKKLLHDLYYNISFSIICAIALVIASMIHAVVGAYPIKFSLGPCQISESVGSIFVTPLVVYITATVFLNVVMIVKRMHALLTT